MVTTPTAWNEHQIEGRCSRSATSLGIPLRFQGPVAPRDNGDTDPLMIQPQRATWDRIGTLVSSERREPAARPAPVSARRPRSPWSARRNAAATCSVGVAGVDIDPYGNVQACMHLQESAGSLHEQSIEQIWNHSPLFTRARARAIEAAQRLEAQTQLEGERPRQLNAPLFCLAVEENCGKGCGSCGRP
jgi:mycofactocin biosynthetic radical S-adenosylmethionine protein MftC